MPDLTLDILRSLVAHDTTNPPRLIDRAGIFADLEHMLQPAGFTFELTDLGNGCLNLLAVRGEPHTLFNVHLDTVPASEGWDHDPFDLVANSKQAAGLGACDVKGAAASLITGALSSSGSAALLFTSDEEAGDSRCVSTLVADLPSFVKRVVVAEPTGCKAITSHRGLQTCEGIFQGSAGHGSTDPLEVRSAIHDAARWVDEALTYANHEEKQGHDPLRGIRLNVGVIEGGVKANVIAPSARVVYGVRPRPEQDVAALLDDLGGLAPDPTRVTWAPRFMAPVLSPTESSLELVRELGLEPGQAVDFWTEAALFAEAGLPSIVFGPGDIAQAHTPNEWIALDQLQRSTDIYTRLFSGEAGDS